MRKIREAREDEKKKKTDPFITDAVIDGCQVKIHFADNCDNKTIANIRSMLMSAHLDAVLIASSGGE